MTPTPGKITLVIVDDHHMVREGLKTVLKKYRDIEIVGEAGTMADAITLVEEIDPRVALMDLRLPDGDGIEACRRCLAAGVSTQFLMLTSFLDEDTVLRAVHAGAQGYLLKEIHPDGLNEAIHKVAAGETVWPPEVTRSLVRGLRHDREDQGVKARLQLISPQEMRVMELVAAGRINKEIAEELGLSEKTVKNYLYTIFKKLEVGRRSQVAAIHATYVRVSGRPAA